VRSRSGVRVFGNHVFSRDARQGNVFHVFQSIFTGPHHGFPFSLLLRPGNKIGFTAATPISKKRFAATDRQFPCAVRSARGLDRIRHTPARPELRDRRWTVTAKLQTIPVILRLSIRPRRPIIVYSTDSEHRLDVPDAVEGAATFFADADLVSSTPCTRSPSRVGEGGLGHSSNVVGSSCVSLPM